MIRNIGKILVLIGVVILLASFVPWISCTLEFPGNISDLRIALGQDDLSASMSGAGLCWDVHPVWASREGFVSGMGALLVGAIMSMLGKPQDRRAALPERLEQEARVRHRPVREPMRSTKVTQRELEQGIEIELEDEGLANILKPEGEKVESWRSTSKEDQEQGQTLMDQVGIQISETRRMEAIIKEEEATIDGFFSPSGMSRLPVLYVDPEHDMAGFSLDEGEQGSREVPYSTIKDAIIRARQLVRETQRGVQIRVMPGVYKEHVVLPPQVAIVNHRMPAEGGPEERLRWLQGQRDVGDVDRVTILIPSMEKIGVRFDPGGGQGIFGCHIVGRGKAGQVGIRLSRGEKVSVVSCVVEQFDQGGAFVELSGSDISVGGIRFVGSIFRDNKSPEGGAIAATESAVKVESCLFERNRSKRGGALCFWGMRGMCSVTTSEFLENKSQVKHLPVEALEDLEPARWEEQEGTGGAIWVGSSQIKIVDCEFRSNGASMSGGAIACIASRMLMQGTDRAKPLVMKDNRSRSGGAILAVGGYDEETRSIVKLSFVECEKNFGQKGGGALLALGGSVIQASNVGFEYNKGDDVSSLGGAVYLLHGAELLGTELLVRANEASMGGGVASVNGSIRLKDRCVFQDNVAQLESCGAMYAGVQVSSFVEEAIGNGELKLPFVVKLLDVECTGNLAMEEPSAVGIGDVNHKQSVMTMGVELSDRLSLRSNHVKGGGLDAQDGALRVIWKGEERVRSMRGRVEAKRFKLS